MLETIFQYGPFTIRTFNILLAVAFLTGGVALIRHIQRHKLNITFFSSAFIYLLGGGLLGGRAAYILEHLAIFKAYPISAFFIWDMHFSFFGILYGVILALFIAARSLNEDFWAWFDAISISGLIALIFVHIGHFFNGTHYGIPTELPWGVTFDTQNIPFISPIHPTQLYAALLVLAVYLYSRKAVKRIHLPGVVGGRALMVYSVGMLGIDFLYGAPSLYVKITYGILAALGFMLSIHCAYKTHQFPAQNNK
jgi:phosphatidylglycerol:prolipoprotein diacylglycerol transferase